MAGELKSVTIGARRLIPLAEVERAEHLAWAAHERFSPRSEGSPWKANISTRMKFTWQGY